MSSAHFIDPAALAPRLGETGLVIVDVCRDDNWQTMHLPGAVHVSPRELVSGVEPATGKLPGPDRIGALFARIGLTPATHIIAYDDEGGGWAGRLLWTLHVAGHERHSCLDGGLVAWSREGYPVTREVSAAPVPVAPQPVAFDASRVVTRDELLSRLHDPDLVLWDARSPEEYAGTRQHAARGGHIPGAVNLEWTALMDPARNLRLRGDVREQLAAAGITGDRPIVTYCQTHHRSSLTWLVGKSLGYDIRGYDGSWAEWGNDPTTPVER